MSPQNITPDSDTSRHGLGTLGATNLSPDSKDDHHDKESSAAPRYNRLRRLLEFGEYPWPLSLDVFEQSPSTISPESKDDNTRSNTDQDALIQEPPKPIDTTYRVNGSNGPLHMPHHVFAGCPTPPPALLIQRPVATRPPVPPRPPSANSFTRRIKVFDYQNWKTEIIESPPLSRQQMHHQPNQIEQRSQIEQRNQIEQRSQIEPCSQIEHRSQIEQPNQIELGATDLFQPTFQPISADPMANYMYYLGMLHAAQQTYETPYALTPICPPTVPVNESSSSRRRNPRRQRPVRFEQTFAYHNGR